MTRRLAYLALLLSLACTSAREPVQAPIATPRVATAEQAEQAPQQAARPPLSDVERMWAIQHWQACMQVNPQDTERCGEAPVSVEELRASVVQWRGHDGRIESRPVEGVDRGNANDLREAEATAAEKTRIIFGTSYESTVPLTENQAWALRLIGFDVIRPTIRPDEVNPAKGVWNWRIVDQNIEVMRLAGFQIVPSTHWFPAWWSDGKPTYEMYTAGCTRFKVGAQSVMDIEFDTSKPYCAFPPHIWDRDDPHPNPNETGGGAPDLALKFYWQHFLAFPSHNPAFVFGGELAKRHGRSIWAYAIGNEFGEPIYWAPSQFGRAIGARRFIVEVQAPMTAGIRAIDRKAQFVGPEAEHGELVQYALEVERDLAVELYDAVSFHPYPWSDNWLHVFSRIDDEFVPARLSNGLGRSNWYSECGGFPDSVEFVRRVVTSVRDVAVISIGDYRQWFVTGSWDAGKPVLNERGLEMRKLIREVTGGRKMRLHVLQQQRPLRTFHVELAEAA